MPTQSNSNGGGEDFNDQLRSHYENCSLTDGRVNSLCALANEARDACRARWWCRMLVVTAAALALFIAGVFITYNESKTAEKSQLLANISEQVAQRHEAPWPVNAMAASYTELEQRLDEVPFALKPPYPEWNQQYKLVAGRYCSLGGNMAVHLQLQHKETGDIVTVYVTQANPQLQRIAYRTEKVGQLEVQFMQKDGLFYAITRQV